jgi:hypothetical protein
MEEYEETKNYRERIMKELVDVKQVLEQILATQSQDSGAEPIPQSIEAREKTTQNEEEKIQLIV